MKLNQQSPTLYRKWQRPLAEDLAPGEAVEAEEGVAVVEEATHRPLLHRLLHLHLLLQLRHIRGPSILTSLLETNHGAVCILNGGNKVISAPPLQRVLGRMFTPQDLINEVPTSSDKLLR